ncbi:hypothetical protein [Dasania marina]|uniref:hypothetical protein n=1 Tax=Dasania marina TaxID=471499 RepID=UPI0030DBBEDD|tara:strand:- start:16886 stop:17269 length:384 start_codon:yes stop_codon:yes gene_type:complete
MKQHLTQILIGLLVTIIGGISVYYITAYKASTKTALSSKNKFLELKIDIDGQQNDVFLNQGKTEMAVDNISVKGSQKDLTYNIPPNYKVYINVDGQQNTVHIDDRLRDFVFVNDKGAMSRVYFTSRI